MYLSKPVMHLSESFQRFIIILTEHLAECETKQQDYNTPWYKWVIERLQQVFLLVSTWKLQVLWWCHQMKISSVLLAICVGNSPVNCEFPAQRPVTRRFDVFFDLHLNKWLSKQSWGWLFRRHRTHYDVTVMHSDWGLLLCHFFYVSVLEFPEGRSQWVNNMIFFFCVKCDIKGYWHWLLLP